jgi:hypothetical protein
MGIWEAYVSVIFLSSARAASEVTSSIKLQVGKQGLMSHRASHDMINGLDIRNTLIYIEFFEYVPAAP